VGAIALSIEAPFIFERADRHGLCAHQVFFKAQSLAGPDCDHDQQQGNFGIENKYQ
jgi:hypothetical protein